MNLNKYCNVLPIDMVSANLVFIRKPDRVQLPTSEMQILEKVSLCLQVPDYEILSKSRVRHICEARFIAIYFIRKLNPNLTLQSIGRLFKRDHSTVINALTVHEELMKYNKYYKRKVIMVLPKLADIRRTYAK